MLHMFDRYVKHSTGDVDHDELGKITGRTILMFCETMRFWSAYRGVIYAIEHNPSEILPVGGRTKHRIDPLLA